MIEKVGLRQPGHCWVRVGRRPVRYMPGHPHGSAHKMGQPVRMSAARNQLYRLSIRAVQTVIGTEYWYLIAHRQTGLKAVGRHSEANIVVAFIGFVVVPVGAAHCLNAILHVLICID